VTATPSTVTSSSAAFGRWAFGIGQPRRDRRGRTGIVKGRSVRSGGNVLTTLSCSASGIFAICCDLTRPTITRHARTFHSTRTRRRREPYIPLVAFCLRHFLADFIICMCEFDFRQAQAAGPPGGKGPAAGSHSEGAMRKAPSARESRLPPISPIGRRQGAVRRVNQCKSRQILAKVLITGWHRFAAAVGNQLPEPISGGCMKRLGQPMSAFD
jgi:hypothetical protein